MAKEVNMATIAITGSGPGIRKAIAKYFAEKGWKFATMRKPSRKPAPKSPRKQGVTGKAVAKAAPPKPPTLDELRTTRTAHTAWWLLLLLVLGVSVFIRVADYGAWQDNRERYFFDDEPLLLNADGYHYLRLARDYRDGRYEPTDELRTTPEHPMRPRPVPLLSWLTATVSAVSPLSLAWTAVLLPVVLSLLLAIPMLMLCRQLQIPPFASLVATLVALNTQLFITRTRMGAFDTDCLIVAFALGAQVAALGFGLSHGRRRYLYLIGAALNAALFALWWDQAPEAVALICLIPLLFSALWYYRPQRREALIVAALGLVLLALLALLWRERLSTIGRNLEEVLRFGARGAATDFPNVATDIAELGSFDLQWLIANSTGFLPTLLLGIAGLVWLLRAQPKAAFTVLLVPVLLALSAFFIGQRGLLFWGPPLGIGTAFILSRAARHVRRFTPHWVSGIIIAAGAVFAIVPPLASELDSVVQSPRITLAIPVIQAIREHTPPDALLWAPWTLGYPAMYYTGRRVITDGQFMSGERQVYANMPLASDDPVFARNFIRFYAQQGLSGLRRINQLAGSTAAGLRWMREWFGKPADAAAQSLRQLAADDPDFATVEACRAFLFPDNTETIVLPIYHEQLTSKWFWYGTWDPVQGEGLPPAHLLFHNAQLQGDTLIASEDFSFNVRDAGTTTLNVNGENIRQPINKFITHNGSALEETDYGHSSGLHFEWIPSARFGILMTHEIAESIINRLFIRHTMDPAYFRHIVVQSPVASLWEVGALPRTP